MSIFKRKNGSSSAAVSSAARLCSEDVRGGMDVFEKALYDKLRATVPVIDAAIGKIVRLTGGYRIVCSDESMQKELDRFTQTVPVGLTGRSIQCFTDGYLESLLTYGNAVGEIAVDFDSMKIAALLNGDPSKTEVIQGAATGEPIYCVKDERGKLTPIGYPQLILFSALNPPPGKAVGVSVLRGLPALSGILMKIYKCIGQNYERAGNVRYAVTYKPGDGGQNAFTKERAMQIAKEWSDGMNAAKNGEIRDFVAVGDVDIKVIGAENQLFDTEVPVRQLLEQLVAKLSVPPFLLGLNWSTTERMSSQQADILTSELEYYRRLLTPVIKKIAEAFLRLSGSSADAEVVWDNINLQDESVLAEARLKNAQAMEIEERLGN